MAGSQVARFEGTEECIRNLQAYEKRILNRYLKQGYMDAAEIVRADAENRAPVLTGRLAGSMLAEWNGRKRQARVGPRANAYYGLFQEIGTSKMAAQPFLRPALDANVTEIRDAIAAVLHQAAEAKL